MKQLPHSIMTDRRSHEESWQWCEQQWGPRWSAVDNREGTWATFYRGHTGQYQWYFETEQQAMLFALRWL